MFIAILLAVVVAVTVTVIPLVLILAADTVSVAVRLIFVPCLRLAGGSKQGNQAECAQQQEHFAAIL